MTFPFEDSVGCETGESNSYEMNMMDAGLLRILRRRCVHHEAHENLHHSPDGLIGVRYR